MARKLFFWISGLSLAAVALLYPFWPGVIYALIIIIPYILIGIRDLTTSHNILRNYPVIGHLRYMFEFIRPEIQQYFIATNTSGRPYNREQRNLIYRRSKALRDTLPFGSQHDQMDLGYVSARHSMAPTTVPESEARIQVGGEQCTKPYLASRLNISAMSFGSLSFTAVEALNRGAQLGNFAQNTGEGGLSKYHLMGGDLIWQLGTAYFGCRTNDGHFCPEIFKEKASLDNVKMIEIKISQGAKPSHGGVLPKAKISDEIAEIRGISKDQDCISPPSHSMFSNPIELLEFVKSLRELSGGKPVGFKFCVGKRREFMGICKAMLKTGILPDFVTVDGSEGGTGAAPVEFTNRLGTPSNEAIIFVHSCLTGVNLRDKVRIIASGKVATGFDVLHKLALGADMCNAARSMMFALGCIQALSCDTNHCPTGVTTQEHKRALAIDVPVKSKRVTRYHDATLKSFLELAGALGVKHIKDLSPTMIERRVSDSKSKTFNELYHYLAPGELLSNTIHEAYAQDWAESSADYF